MSRPRPASVRLFNRTPLRRPLVALPCALACSGLFALTESRPSAPGPESAALQRIEGSTNAERFGASVALAGDLDGDGTPDLAVGAPHADPGGASSGEVRVYSGASGALLLHLPGDDPADWFGFAIANAGDVDRDGRTDLLVGAPMGKPRSGSVTLHSGADGSVLQRWEGSADGERFGFAVAGLGDVDGDGIPDIAVGAPGYDGAGTNAGSVRIFSGRGGALLHELTRAPWDMLGSSLAAIGDVDGDGRGDLLVGAPFADVGGFNAGSALVVSGSDGTVLSSHHGSAIGDWLGSTVASAGDVDGDGVPDLSLGAPGADVNGIDSGAVVVRSGADGSVLLVVGGLASGELLAVGVGLGDVNGDGLGDLLLGAPSAHGSGSQAGTVRLVSGSDGAELGHFSGLASYDWLGASVAALGDVDGDGTTDVLVGAPGHDDYLDRPGQVLVISGALRD